MRNDNDLIWETFQYKKIENPSGMNKESKIESIIEAECFDDKPSDIEWNLRKEDVALISKNIKEQLIEEMKNRPHTFEDALEAVMEF